MTMTFKEWVTGPGRGGPGTLTAYEAWQGAESARRRHESLSAVADAAAATLKAVTGGCKCTEPQCPANMARVGLDAMARVATRAGDLEAAFITYDADLFELARVAALRIKAGIAAGDSYGVLAEAFEELTRQLYQDGGS